tara:strand:- start:83 stop:604 length:522 start_codon:yes stop_codon:yes gene_type:complete
MGTAIPSIALGSTAFMELIIYHGFRDNEIFMKVCIIEVCLFMVALLRRDARARSEAIGIPLSGTSLVIEEYIRKRCTFIHTSIICTLLATFVLLWAVVFYKFWNFSGTAFEMKRTSFTLCMAECGLLAFLAGQDRSPSYHIVEKSCNILHKVSRFVHVKLHRMHEKKNRKKHL